MHVILASAGTDGDVYPYIGLGTKLRSRGHRITLVANEHYQSQAAELGFSFRALFTDEETEIAEGDEGEIEDDDLDTASTTAPLAFADEEGGEDEGATGELTEEGELIDGEGVTAPRRGRAAVAVAAPAPVRAGIFWTILLFLGFIPCAQLVAILVDDSMEDYDVIEEPSPHVEWLLKMIGEEFWKDAAWKSQMRKGAPDGTVGTDVTDLESQFQQPILDSGQKLKVYLREYNRFGSYKDPDAPKTGAREKASSGS